MINLYNSHITDILPTALADDPRTKALSYALNREMQRLIEYCQNISVYATIDTLPEQILDLLAVELNTQYYDDSLSIRIKRNLIKNSLKWYMNTGTLAAVEEAVSAVFGNGEVKEWFDYGGKPYHFKIHTSNINTTDEMIRQVTDIVSSIQNVRSQLEEVIVEVMQQVQLYHGCVVEVIVDSITIGIEMSDEIFAENNKSIQFIDRSTGDIYATKVINGKLTLVLEENVLVKTNQFIQLLDLSTGMTYTVKVQNGKLTFEEGGDSSVETKNHIQLFDEKNGIIHTISVNNGKLIMQS